MPCGNPAELSTIPKYKAMVMYIPSPVELAHVVVSFSQSTRRNTTQGKETALIPPAHLKQVGEERTSVLTIFL